MQIDDKLITYLEDLSCLTFTEDEKIRLKEDLDKILNSMEQLSNLDTTGVPERSHPFDNVNAFREDEIKPSFNKDLVLKNAVVKGDDMFTAPKTVD